MWKQSIAFILLIAFMVQAFSKIFVVIDYNINTAAYEAQCINKANIAMKCKGKCQMLKALEQENKKDQQYPDRRGENKYDIVISDKNYFTQTVRPIDAENDFIFPEYSFGKVAQIVASIFHPPC